jgi:hypothetical protein
LLIAHDMDGDSTLDWDYTEPWLIWKWNGSKFLYLTRLTFGNKP